MGIFGFLSRFLKKKRHIDVKMLPSQGFFYKKDFKIFIKKADVEDVNEYESNYDKENLSAVLGKLKSIVRKNVILDGGYEFSYIKSIDIVYLFLEIVRFTKGKPVTIDYFDDQKGTIEQIQFGSESFNYFEPTENLMDKWDSELRCFDLNGYKLSLPSIGIENSLTQYLIEKSYEPGAEKYNDYSYNFTFFLDGKDRLKFDEIDNLIQIFNFDLDEDEKIKVDDAVEIIKPMQRYTLRKNGRVIEMSSKINLEKIWK
jgi:hypothetical protein